MHPLPRSRFLTASSALAAVAVIRPPARAAQFTYKLATSDPVGLARQVRLTQMCNAIRTETNGRLDIQLFPNSILGGQASMIAQLRLGGIHFYSNLDSGYATVVPVAAINSVGFAFPNRKAAFDTMSGPLGVYLRNEFKAKGLYLCPQILEAGFRQCTSWTKPIRTVDDFAGFKLRVPGVAILVDLFRTLGASPTPIDSNELYTSLQTHLVDGQELPLDGIEYQRIYEVQRYVSLTNHVWGGFWLAGNLDAWNALPPDVQDTFSRNAAKYIMLQRHDSAQLNAQMADKLRRQGLTFNTPDPAPMRAKLAPYYARWKNNLGSTAWDLLEASVGRLA